MIKVNQLEKYFNKGKKNELHALKGVSVTFEDKGLVCILGESGSGKTTLLNAIGGLDTFQGGSMEIEGITLNKYDSKAVEKIRNDKYGYIFQNYYLLQDYTVAYNVKLALNTFDISEEEKDQRVEYVLQKLDIAKYKKKLVSQLSGGQQQRVSIARALVKSSKIILADEPTGNLDEENTLHTMSILRSIAKECLVILVSHEKRIARFFADRIIEIADGCIVKDYENKNQTAYQRMDDGNIYLQDMECTDVVENDKYEIHVYEEEQTQDKIRLNLAWKNGKLYIQNLENYDVLFEGAEAGCEMIDDTKPDIDMEDVEEFEFSLPRLKDHKKAKLSKKEIWKLALENIRLMGKKQAFIVGILVVAAVMLTITIANFTNGVYYNERDVVSEDSHYVTVGISPQESVDDDEYDKAFEAFCQKNAFTGANSDIYRSNGGALSLQCDSFRQLASSGVVFKKFSYVSLNEVSKKNLIFGRMPEKRNEIVVDRWLFDTFFAEGNSYQAIYRDVKSFLNEHLTSDITGDTFQIVGISDKGEPSIYMDQYTAMGISINGDKIATLEQLQKEYPGQYDKQTLGDHEIMVSKEEMKGYKRRKVNKVTMENGNEYTIVGAFPNTFHVKYILNDKDCQELRNQFILASKGYNVYTQDTKKTIAALKKAAQEYSDIFTLSAYSPSQKQIAHYQKKQKERASGSRLIMVAAILVSLFIIYFTIKSNVTSRTEELTVYRLIGIAQGSIIKAYLLEMLLITSYTVLPTVLIVSGVIQFFGSIPSLELGLIFPWWTSVALIAALYVLNLLISYIPVKGILAKPPAVLAVKE